jgi:hypothetical protein
MENSVCVDAGIPTSLVWITLKWISIDGKRKKARIDIGLMNTAVLIFILSVK